MSAVALVDQRTRTAPSPVAAATELQPAAGLSTGGKVLALGIMCLGFFIAYLDIQIVAASIQEIGGGLSASQDEISWVQTSYLKFDCLGAPNRRS